MRLRELSRADWPQVLALNLASERHLSALDGTRLQYLLSLAHRSLVIEAGGKVVAFAIAIAPGAPYDSRNYGWFAEHLRLRGYLQIGRNQEASRQTLPAGERQSFLRERGSCRSAH